MVQTKQKSKTHLVDLSNSLESMAQSHDREINVTTIVLHAILMSNDAIQTMI